MNVGIIGAGPTGRAIAEGLAGAARILLADRYPDRAKAAVTGIRSGVVPASVDEALEADIVVLALSTPGTTRFARENALRLLGKWVVAVEPVRELLASDLPLSSVFVAGDDEGAKERVMELVKGRA